MRRQNCWEYFQCGFEPGGSRVKEYGVCPAAISGPYDGMNRGRFAGRFCWAIEGTIGDCKKIGTKEEQLMRCIQCEFMKKVHDDESSGFVLIPPLVDFFE